MTRSALRWTLELAAVFALTLILIRVVYTTELGATVVGLAPEGFWTRAEQLLGLADRGGAESQQDADALIIALACLPLATAGVFGVEWSVRRMRRHWAQNRIN